MHILLYLVLLVHLVLDHLPLLHQPLTQDVNGRLDPNVLLDILVELLLDGRDAREPHLPADAFRLLLHLVDDLLCVLDLVFEVYDLEFGSFAWNGILVIVLGFVGDADLLLVDVVLGEGYIQFLLQFTLDFLIVLNLRLRLLVLLLHPVDLILQVQVHFI